MILKEASILMLVLMVLACCEKEPEPTEADAVILDADPSTYCEKHPGAAPTCLGYELDECKANPFCGTLWAVSCAGINPEAPLEEREYQQEEVPCVANYFCAGSTLQEVDKAIEPALTFGRPTKTSPWYVFFSSPMPEDWAEGTSDTPEQCQDYMENHVY